MSATEPVRDGQGAGIVGPLNPDRGRQNPFTVCPPASDHGTVPVAISTAMAGVNMRLKAGAVRELHWHRKRNGPTC